MSELKFFVGTESTLSVTLLDSNQAPITDGSVSAVIETTEDPPTAVFSGALPHVSDGVYSVVLPADTWDAVAGIECQSEITALDVGAVQIAFLRSFFVPQVRSCPPLTFAGGTGNMTTMVQSIMEDCDRERKLSREVVTRKVIRALETHRWEPLFFNESFFTFTTETEEGIYGPSTIGIGWPANLMWITNMQVRNPVGGDLWQDVLPVSQSNIHEWRNIRNARSVPQYFRWLREQIFLGPIPNRIYTMECDTIIDLGTPGARFEDEKWRFSDPVDPVLDLSDEFTNSWFTWGEALTRATATRMIYEEIYKDQVMARGMRGIEEEERKKLAGFSERRQVPRSQRKSWGWYG